MYLTKSLPKYAETDCGSIKIPQFQCEVIFPMGCGITDSVVGKILLTRVS
jgi:hypothetical protein